MIIGKDVALIEQILRVLTYFVRCSELTENTEECPLLTVDVDDTATLMSASDTPTSVGCSAADVTLSSGSVSTSVRSALSVSGEKLQLAACDSSPAFVLKPAPCSNARDTHVRFENSETQCSVSTSESTDQILQSTTVSDYSVASTAITAEPSTRLGTDSQLVSGPHLWFRSDVPHTMSLGLTCSGCNYIQPCEQCSEYLKNFDWKDISRRDDDDVSSVGNCKSSCCSVSEAPSNPVVGRNFGESLPSSISPKLCQLSPVEANENVRVERVAHVGREPVEDHRPHLHRVPLEKPAVSSLDSCHGSTKSPVLASEQHVPLRPSQVPPYQRGNSIFDEYYDGSSSCLVFDLCSGTSDKSAFGVDDASAFDEIMNEPEPCPDVSHIDVSQHSSSSGSSEVVPEPSSDSSVPPLDSTVPPGASMPETVSDQINTESSSSSPATFDNVFVERHFAVANSDEHLDDIPDGPSKEMISSAIKLMQVVYHTSQSSVDDLDVQASDYFSQTGLGASRGRQRQPSGQSTTSARCR